MPTFADRLREMRAITGETQKQIADILSIAERNYRRYEAGEVDPTASNACKLADHYDVSVDYLLGRRDFWLDAEGNIMTKTTHERQLLFARAREALAAMQAQSAANGVSEMTLDEINAEIAAARKESKEL